MNKAIGSCCSGAGLCSLDMPPTRGIAGEKLPRVRRWMKMVHSHLVDEETIDYVRSSDGLEGSTKHLGVDESLDVLRRKQNVWESFESWYDNLDDGSKNYMDLILQASLVGLAEKVVEGTDSRSYASEAEQILALDNGRDLMTPTDVGPISTYVTRTIIKRTIKKNCATRWAGC